MYNASTFDFDTSVEFDFVETIDRVLKEDEFTEAIKRANVNRSWLRKQLNEKRASIWQGLISITTEYDLVKTELERRVALGPLDKISNITFWLASPFAIILLSIGLYDALALEFSISPLGTPLDLIFKWQYQTALFFVGFVLIFSSLQILRIRLLHNSDKTQFLKAEKDRISHKIKDEALPDLIRQELRALITAHSRESYELNLTINDAPGLAEVYNPIYDIATNAVERLRFMLRTMPGGSIGIAGPRGAGKSTLLRTFCHESLTNLDDRPALTLLTSAPVEYDAREFILYLFGAVCQRVTTHGQISVQNPIHFTSISSSSTLRNLFAKLSPVLVAIGFTMIVAGFGLADSSLASKQLAENENVTSHNLPIKSEAPKPTELSTNVRTLQYATELGFTPALTFNLGLLFFVLGTIGILLFTREKRFVRSFPHQDIANQWLKKIRFQQSYTTGWSGSFKIPLGAETSFNKATTLAQRQLTSPEIADAFVHFLENITNDKIVVIGIDEMDKLASDDKAHRFLNDLKSIFGIPKVFYLVSVSENAMSSFERRGLPFRDAFDSAFDSIVYVDYLDFKGARDLIARRVLGVPHQFVALCYAIAGGLPRDILRAYRNLMDLMQTARSSELSQLSFLLIQAEATNKCRAALVAAERLPGSLARSSMFDTLYHLRLDSDAISWLDAAIRIHNIGTNMVQDKGDDESLTKLVGLCSEFGTYLYFCATLRQFFATSLDKCAFQDAYLKGHIDQLARARQAFSINSIITKSLIDEFRRQRGLDVPFFSS